MRKLLILGLLILSTTTFSQDLRLKELERQKKDYRFTAWSSLSISVFSYGVGACGFINPWSDPQTQSHVFLMGTFGVGFNTLAIIKFAKARQIQRRIDSYNFDKDNSHVINEVKLIKWVH